jgi:hypothetical protein
MRGVSEQMREVREQMRGGVETRSDRDRDDGALR